MIKLSACIMLIAKDVKHAIKLAEELEKSGKFSSVTANVPTQPSVARCASPVQGGKGQWEAKYNATYGTLKQGIHWNACGFDSAMIALASPGSKERETIAQTMFELLESGRLTKNVHNWYYLDGIQISGAGMKTSAQGGNVESVSVEGEIDCDETV